MAHEQIRSVQGTEDVLPAGWGHWRRLYDAARRVFELSGYGEIRTPVIEDAHLFVKGTGETTDIVQKEMYTIPAGQDEALALRPEGTPPVARAYLEHNLHKQQPFQKLYYFGPMFRRERPQRGRLRQFHQLGVEVFGSASPLVDAETILVAMDVFREVGLRKSVLWVNSIGCPECRPPFRAKLRDILLERAAELCPDCLGRMERNVLRVYDCKNEACRRVVDSLPEMADHLCEACAAHYAEVQGALTQAGTAFQKDPRLVRGLDYYTRTVFEIKHPDLGARDAICGGGRYDGLVETLGGPPTPGVGFSIGAEATLLAVEAELGPAADSSSVPAAYVVCFEDGLRCDAFALVQELRRAGVSADMDYEGRSPKSQLRVANRLGVRLCCLLGPDEAARGEVTLKDMSEGRQWAVPLSQAARQAAALGRESER
jgi:histidyl-tRNA synthetase